MSTEKVQTPTNEITYVSNVNRYPNNTDLKVKSCKFISKERERKERERFCSGWREAGSDILLAMSTSPFPSVHAIYQPQPESL